MADVLVFLVLVAMAGLLLVLALAAVAVLLGGRGRLRQRLERLEAQVGRLDVRLAELVLQLQSLDERLDGLQRLPSHGADAIAAEQPAENLPKPPNLRRQTLQPRNPSPGGSEHAATLPGGATPPSPGPAASGCDASRHPGTTPTASTHQSAPAGSGSGKSDSTGNGPTPGQPATAQAPQPPAVAAHGAAGE